MIPDELKKSASDYVANELIDVYFSDWDGESDDYGFDQAEDIVRKYSLDFNLGYIRELIKKKYFSEHITEDYYNLIFRLVLGIDLNKEIEIGYALMDFYMSPMRTRSYKKYEPKSNKEFDILKSLYNSIEGIIWREDKFSDISLKELKSALISSPMYSEFYKMIDNRFHQKEKKDISKDSKYLTEESYNKFVELELKYSNRIFVN